MNQIRVMAVVLVALGVAGLAYGGFTYTKDTHETQIGPIELTVKDQRTVNVPIWAGIGAIVIGVGLLLAPPKK